MFSKVTVTAVLVGASIAASGAGGWARAQMEMPKETVPVGTTITPVQALERPLGLFEMELTGVAKAMPAEKYSFAPSAGTFAGGQNAKFEGVRTFADQLSHLIQANYFFYAGVSGTKPDADLKAIGGMKTKAELVDALAKSFVFAHKAVATITPENAFVTIKPIDGMNTRASLAAFAVAHGYDHYGQMVEYLRMNGVVPPGSK